MLDCIRIVERAAQLIPEDVLNKYDATSILIDIGVADDVFDIDFDKWENASEMDFMHDFLGIIAHVEAFDNDFKGIIDKSFFGGWKPKCCME